MAYGVARRVPGCCGCCARRAPSSASQGVPGWAAHGVPRRACRLPRRPHWLRDTRAAFKRFIGCIALLNHRVTNDSPAAKMTQTQQ
jgi:hypothetical protein